MPLYEINVDCWNTSKGETQSTVNFKPIDELKASAASRIVRPHVLSEHPGFDASLAIGTLTVNMQHKLTAPEIRRESSLSEEEPAKEIDISRRVSDIVAEEIVEKKKFEQDLLNSKANSEGDLEKMHKFISIQFNEGVSCDFCNKKVPFKISAQCCI